MTRTSMTSDFHAALKGVAATFFFNGLLFGAWASRIPDIKSRYQLTDAELGQLLLLLAVSAVISFPLAGKAIDRHGPAFIAALMAALNALGLIGLGHTSTLFATALSLAVFGASHGAMDVAMNAWAGRLENRSRRSFMSRLHALWSLGAGVGALTGVAATSASLNPMNHFTAVCVIACTALGWLTYGQIARQPSTVVHNSDKGSGFSLPQGNLFWLGVIAFCASLGEGAMADWSAVFMRDALATDTTIAAAGYAVFSVAMVSTRLCGDWIIATLQPVRALQLAGCCALAGAVLLLTAGSAYSAFTGFLLLGCGYALAMPIAFSQATRSPHAAPGAAVAAVATMGYGGLLLGPAVIGFIAHAISLRGAFVVLLLTAIAILLLAKRTLD